MITEHNPALLHCSDYIFITYHLKKYDENKRQPKEVTGDLKEDTSKYTHCSLASQIVPFWKYLDMKPQLNQ